MTDAELLPDKHLEMLSQKEISPPEKDASTEMTDAGLLPDKHLEMLSQKEISPPDIAESYDDSSFVVSDDSGDEFVLDSQDEGDFSEESFPGIKKNLKLFDFDEEDIAIVPEKSNPKLFISMVVKCDTTRGGKQKKSSRVYNSYQFCLSCSKKVSNFSQHIFRAHKTETEVKEISQMSVKGERKRAIGLFRQRYNHEFNSMSIKAGKSEIILHRRPTSGVFDLSEYGPCPERLTWVQQRLLKNHEKSCLKKQLQSCPTHACLKIKSDALAGRINTHASERLGKKRLQYYEVRCCGEGGTARSTYSNT